MGIECGTQAPICDLPVRIDTYKGCTHNCKYCFVTRKSDISKIEVSNCEKQLLNFINKKRTRVTNWCDWDIPLHWGGVSDPFQPIEKKFRASYKLLKIFAQTKYPFVVSTKGKLIATDEYLNLLKQCNCVVQISMICDKYDKLEKGAPTYNERLDMCRKVAPNCKRLIVRIQPYMTEVLNDVIDNLPKLKEAGVYGITIEGMKFFRKIKGMERLGGDFVYPLKRLLSDFTKIKMAAHKNGLKFYCAENRLRWFGDSLTCCGCDDLEGFRVNSFNLEHILNGDNVNPTEKMKDMNTGGCFRALFQSTAIGDWIQNNSFYNLMTSKKIYDQQSKSIKG